ncbi:MAG TPA: divalent metal cation transporter [Candidatus Saccharimonadales bacterium]|nr:divalent metal cation transporter [Candidatus Saccharimonadales bacterium]
MKDEVPVEPAPNPVKKILDTEVNLRPVVDKLGFNRFLRILGPGIITGAADDDPSGIATYSQAGAQFGYGLAWTMLFTFPLMTAVQEACARIGAVTGKGLAAVLRDNYSRKVLYPVVALVVAANTFNIGSDIGALGAGVQLFAPQIPFAVIAIAFTVLMIGLEVMLSYKTYTKLLKWLALALLSYTVTALIVNLPWGTVVRATFVPHIQLNADYLFIIVGVLGTTISPYLFFWETSAVVEEEISEHRLAQKGGIPRLSRRFLKNMRLDNAIGMAFSNITAWFIILTAAAVLNSHGITQINSAADAAKALEPLVQGFPNAGLVAKVIFAIGMIGVGLLSVPVLAGSSSYALSEVFGWREGLYRKASKARGFYAVIAIGTLLGLFMNFVGFDPIKALVLTAVFNGIAAVPLIFLILKVGGNREIMGDYRHGGVSRALLWITFLVMGAAALALFASFIHF